MNVGRREYTFLWLIENYSFCWHENGKALVSPEITPEGLEGTAWTLWLFPRGVDSESEGNISVFLARSQNDAGPERFGLKFELSILAADGSVRCCRETEEVFERGLDCGWGNMAKMEELLLRRKVHRLTEDTLSMRCRMWKGEGINELVKEACTRTRIRIEQLSFLHRVAGFRALKTNQRDSILIRFPSERKCVTSSCLYITDDPRGRIRVEITTSDALKILSKCKLYLLDRSGNRIECGAADNRFEVERGNIENLSLSFTREEILSKNAEFLPDGNLSVLCECTFSSGVELQKIERVLHDVSVAVKVDAYDDAAGNRSLYPSALDDLKELYLSSLLCDVELKTETRSFPAHKSVLCARSPVFKAMLSNDMREKTTGCIRVDDLEDAIVQQLLLFLYSDVLEDLQWNTATQLYYAADKYEVRKLKAMCSCFFTDNLGASNAIELLLLADTYNDSDLKKSVEDFILKHEDQIFGSEEWEKLMETNPALVMKTMHLKFKRQKEVK